jgi:hypothetical protein
MKKGIWIAALALAGCGSDKVPDTAQKTVAILDGPAAPLSPAARKKTALDFGDQLSSQFTACQVQRAAVVLAVRNHDKLTAYEAAGHGIEYCGAAATQYRQMTVPTALAADPENTFPLVINACADAATDQADTFRLMQTALDSDRLAEMAKLDTQSQKAGASLDHCRDAISGVVVAFGANKVEADKVTWVLR